ncbi:citrate-proton symporter [Salmonella enterica subsp. enterica]|uniref:Citrate-proton symporter n=1 Tax=Salmonella enterica I TaxID=59201 RepID=A0A379WDH6_SALET|nr:citrate-proton symporter [Salmonella enterica subsp. enterica]
MQWLTAAPDFTRMTLVLLWFSFFFGMYNGAMVAALTEVMPVYVRTVGFSLAFSLATAIFWRPDAGHLYRAGKVNRRQKLARLVADVRGVMWTCRDGDAVCTSESRLYRGRK